MKTRSLFACLVMLVSIVSGGSRACAETIVCGETGPKHLQGVDSDGSSIWWSFTAKLVRTDLTGAVLATAEVQYHSGDLCVHNGEVYVATDHGRFSQSGGRYPQEVRVYDGATLKLKRKYSLDDVCGEKYAMSNITYANGRFYLSLGLDATTVERTNTIVEFTPSFDEVARHVLPTGYCTYGLQTLAWHGGNLYLGNYGGTDGDDTVTGGAFVCDAAFGGCIHTELPASEGVMSVTGVLYTASSAQQKDGTWKATAVSRPNPCDYVPTCASGGVTRTPASLVDLGFPSASRYYADADQTVAGPLDGDLGLLANATPLGGRVITLADALNTFTGALAVPSGTLVVPSVGAANVASAAGRANAPNQPVVLSEGTIRFTGAGGRTDRDFILAPMAGCETRAAAIDVAEGVTVTTTGRFRDHTPCGNLVKTGAGTFVLATEAGDNFIGVDGKYGPYSYRDVLSVADNGDVDVSGHAAFSVANGRFVLATAPDVVTTFGNESAVGVQTTADGVETAGHFDLVSGTANFLGWFAVGRLNGTTVTVPQGLVSTVNVSGGSLLCKDFGVCYGANGFAGFTARPVVNVHGGLFAVSGNTRLDHTNSWGTVNVDGGVFASTNLYNGYYQAGAHLTVNVSTTGQFRVLKTLDLANHSSAECPSVARVNVFDGGRLAARGVQMSKPGDVELHFDGGTFESLTTSYSDFVAEGVTTYVGAKGMAHDITGDGNQHWGVDWRGDIVSEPGVVDGGLRIYNTSSTHATKITGTVDLKGDLAIERTRLTLGGDIRTRIVVRDTASRTGANEADVTVDGLVFEGRTGALDCGFSGGTTDPGVHAYVLTAKAFTPPAGSIKVYCYKTSSTTASYPYGTHPFLRFPAATPCHAAQFVCSAAETDTRHFRFVESEADGWRTISIVIEETSGLTAIDPRTSDEWLSGTGRLWKVGSGCFDYAGADATCANPFLGFLAADGAGGVSVTANELTLTGGGRVPAGEFDKLGAGTLTFSGDRRAYEFATFAFDGGTVRVGTGDDSPEVTSTGDGFFGNAKASETGLEGDVALEVRSGLLSVGGNFYLNYGRGSWETAANLPLRATVTQDGGTVELKNFAWFNGDDGKGPFVSKDTLYTLNAGTLSVGKALYLGENAVNSGLASDATNTTRFVMNGGRLEVGEATAGSTKVDGKLVLCTKGGAHDTTAFEMNGGEADLWKGLAVNAAANADCATHVWLNGGTMTLWSPTFTGAANSHLHLNGGVLGFANTKHVGELTDTLFSGFTTVTVEEGGAIFDFSKVDCDYLHFKGDLQGSGPVIVRGGDTNRCFCINKANLSHAGDYYAEKGGVIQFWGNAAGKRFFIRDGGGYSYYYGSAVKEIHAGEKPTDVTCLYGYGFSQCSVTWASDAFSITGTVYHCWRIRGDGNGLRMPKGKFEALRGPKGCFADLDVANQVKPHPAVVRPGATYVYTLDTSNASYDRIFVESSMASTTAPADLDVQPYPDVVEVNEPIATGKAGNVVSTVPQSSENRHNNNPTYLTEGGGTVRVNAPFTGAGTVRLCSGRIEGRPENFDGVTLDLNNASVRFTESGTTTAKIMNSKGAKTGIGLEVADGKSVTVTGSLVTNASCLVMKGPGTLVLRDEAAWRQVAGEVHGKATSLTSFSIPENGDLPNSAAFNVMAGTLVFDMAGTVAITNGSNTAMAWVGSHYVPDGQGGAYPAVCELWRGDLVDTYDNFVVGRHDKIAWDDCSQFSRRPYAAFNIRGGSLTVNGIILGYTTYYFKSCERNEINVWGGRINVGEERFAIGHDPTNVKIGDELGEAVVNVYGGEVLKPSGKAVSLGTYGDGETSYPGIGRINMYGGQFLCGPDVQVSAPGNNHGHGFVNLCGGVLQAKNIVRAKSGTMSEGHVHFDGGTFRPLQAGASMKGLTDVTVGAGGGTVELVDGQTYTIAQAVTRAADLGDDGADGGLRAAGDGTLVLGAANAFTGPVGAVGADATLKLGVAGAFSDCVVLEGGTIDLNGQDVTFRSVSGFGRIVNGNVRVTESLAVEGEAGSTLAFGGNLTVAAGAYVGVPISADGTGDQINVEGNLVFEGKVGFDLGRYDDNPFDGTPTYVVMTAASIDFSDARLTGYSCGKGKVSWLSVSSDGKSLVSSATRKGTCLIVR